MTPTVSLQKGPPAAGWQRDLRAWVDESRTAARARRRRALPVRLATLGTLVATLTVLGVLDAVHGVALQAYFWATLGIVGIGLLAGLVLRRTPWSVALLLVPAAAGLVAFGGSHTRLHDGVGTRTWMPTSAGAVHYRLFAGRAELDLRGVPAERLPRRIGVTVGTGEVRVVAPSGVRLTVHARVRFGQLERADRSDGSIDSGGGLRRTYLPAAGATGPAVSVTVELAEGRVLVERA